MQIKESQPSRKHSVAIPRHTNNFDFLRLLLATLVMVTHSYLLTGVSEANDPLNVFSHQQISLATLSVCGFLVISGYLVTKSLRVSSSVGEFYLKRTLRVFPALWAMVFVTILAGCFLSHRPALTYFTDPTVRLYAQNAVLHLFLKINGVFEQNPYPGFINGSLWTVPVEVFFYLVLSLLFGLRQHVKWLGAIIGALLLLTSGLWLAEIKLPDVPFLQLASSQLALLGGFFLAGALLSLFTLPAASVRGYVAAGAGSGLVLVCWLGGYQQTQFVLLPLAVIAFGTLYTPALAWAGRYGDLSYGVYIWGYFIQQVLAQFIHLSPVAMMALSMPLTFVVAYASWHLVEKKPLQWKFARRRNSRKSSPTSSPKLRRRRSLLKRLQRAYRTTSVDGKIAWWLVLLLLVSLVISVSYYGW